jgi:hypothetical protein
LLRAVALAGAALVSALVLVVCVGCCLKRSPSGRAQKLPQAAADDDFVIANELYGRDSDANEMYRAGTFDEPDHDDHGRRVCVDDNGDDIGVDDDDDCGGSRPQPEEAPWKAKPRFNLNGMD